jgi:hypothetical protein
VNCKGGAKAIEVFKINFVTTYIGHHQHGCFNIETNNNHGGPKHNGPIQSSLVLNLYKKRPRNISCFEKEKSLESFQQNN